MLRAAPAFSGWPVGLALLLAGCGRDVGLSVAARLEAIDTVQAAFESRNRDDREAANAALIELMAGLPEFEDAGASDDGSVWGRFVDGRLLVVANNREPEGDSAGRAAGAPRAALTELPEGARARFLDTLGSIFDHAGADVQPDLLEHGYTSAGSPRGAATVDELEDVSEDAVFYFDTHGGSGRLRDNSVAYGLFTGTPVTEASEETYEDDLDDLKLSYMLAAVDELPTGQQVAEKRYAVMPGFVADHWSFAPESLVVMAACGSNNATFKQAVLDAGAGLYVGWTTTTASGAVGAASRFLFDRMLGENRVAPVDDPDAPPMDRDEVAAAMSTTLHPFTGLPYDTSPNTGSKLTFTVGSDEFGTLVPSLRETSVDADAGLVTLTGIFGATEGGVKDADTGASLVVRSWSATSVVAELPSETHRVLVQVDTRPGNALPVGLDTWVLSGVDGGAFDVDHILKVSIVDGDVIYEDPSTAVEGPRGPFTFTTTGDAWLHVQVWSTAQYGGFGDLYLLNPTGTRWKIQSGIPDAIPGDTDVVIDFTTRLANWKDL